MESFLFLPDFLLERSSQENRREGLAGQLEEIAIVLLPFLFLIFLLLLRLIVQRSSASLLEFEGVQGVDLGVLDDLLLGGDLLLAPLVRVPGQRHPHHNRRQENPNRDDCLPTMSYEIPIEIVDGQDGGGEARLHPPQ